MAPEFITETEVKTPGHLDTGQNLETLQSELIGLDSPPDYHLRSPTIEDTVDDDYEFIETTLSKQGPRKPDKPSSVRDIPSPCKKFHKLEQEEFLHCLTGIVSYCLFVGTEFSPSQRFCDNFKFRKCLDFSRRFRLRYKLFYISNDYKKVINEDTEKFISKFIKRKYGGFPIIDVFGR